MGKASVIVIDHDPATVRRVENALDTRRCDVVSVPDTDQGLERATVKAPALIVLNVDLAKGWRLCTEFKRNPTFAPIPLAVVSERASQETFTQHQRLPTRADAYLLKPLGDSFDLFVSMYMQYGGDDEGEIQELDELELIDDGPPAAPAGSGAAAPPSAEVERLKGELARALEASKRLESTNLGAARAQEKARQEVEALTAERDAMRQRADEASRRADQASAEASRAASELRSATAARDAAEARATRSEGALTANQGSARAEQALRGELASIRAAYQRLAGELRAHDRAWRKALAAAPSPPTILDLPPSAVQGGVETTGQLDAASVSAILGASDEDGDPIDLSEATMIEDSDLERLPTGSPVAVAEVAPATPPPPPGSKARAGFKAETRRVPDAELEEALDSLGLE